MGLGDLTPAISLGLEDGLQSLGPIVPGCALSVFDRLANNSAEVQSTSCQQPSNLDVSQL